MRHGRPRLGELVDILGGQAGQNGLEPLSNLVRAEPGQGPDDLASPAAGGRELPARRMAQFDAQITEAQAANRDPR